MGESNLAGLVTATSMSDQSHPRRGAFFGRRKGHALRPRQARLFQTLLPRLALNLAAPTPVDLALLFPDPVESVRLEIGFGGGEHMIAQAETAALEATLHPGRKSCGDRAHPAARWRIAVCNGRCRLRVLDAQAPDPIGRF